MLEDLINSASLEFTVFMGENNFSHIVKEFPKDDFSSILFKVTAPKGLHFTSVFTHRSFCKFLDLFCLNEILPAVEELSIITTEDLYVRIEMLQVNEFLNLLNTLYEEKLTEGMGVRGYVYF